MNSRSAPQVAMSEAQLAARCPGCPRPTATATATRGTGTR
jgi:hypothetical protein